MTTARRWLVAALLALAALYAAWFGQSAEWVAVAVFALPPVLFALGVLRGGRQSAFWAGVLALVWFSHGVMAAWTQPETRGFALGEVLLSLVIVAAASVPGLRARFGARRTPRL